MEEMRQPSEFGEAMDNARDIDILDCSAQDIFNVMQETLLKAFDRETTFDMRLLEQMELMGKECSVGIVNEKDGLLYPFVKLAIAIRDGYYDDVEKQFKLYKKRDAEFEVMFTPFTCSLDKFRQRTGGIYSGSDKELTTAWRHILIQTFPKWEEKFKEYLGRIKAAKLGKIEDDAQSKIDRVNREKKAVSDKIEEEYKAELETIGLE